jgi:hypothetical protein
MNRSMLERLVQFDQTRKSFPGEHWMALAAGFWFLRRKPHSLPGRLWSKAIGAALIVRAASGRDGLRKLWKEDVRPRPASGQWPGRQPSLRGEDLPAVTGTSPRAALLQSPDSVGRATPEGASSVRSGGFPDFR